MIRRLTFILMLAPGLLNAQLFRKEDYRAGIQQLQLKATPDGGYAVAGVLPKDGIEVRKYNSSRNLQWVKTYYSDSIPDYNNVIGTQIIPMNDGSFIVSADLFECDILSGNHLMHLSADGNEIYWEKRLYYYEELFAATDSTFLRGSSDDQDAADLEVWHKDGYLLPNTLTGIWPPFRLPVNSGGDWICASDAMVYRANWAGEISGLPWFAPEEILQLDTIPGGGLVAFGAATAYFLDDNLALTAIRPLPFDASQWKIHTCSKGFISTKNVLSNQINTYNPAFNSIGVLGLNATFLESDYLVRADTFFWAGLHSIGDLDDRLWVLSDTVGLSGVWNTGTDIQLTDIALGGVPTGTTFMVPIPWVPAGTHTAYSANYSNVLVTVKNTGSDTIHHCKVQCLWVSSCAELCGNFEESIEVSFDQLLLAPGESTVLDLDTLEVYCSNQNLENLCLNVTEVNHRREKNDLNNANCTYIPNLYVGTDEPRLIYVEVTPNPATDVLHIELSDSSEPSTYAIYSLDGKMVKKGDFNAGEPVVVEELSGGFYWFTLTDNDGRVGRRGFVKVR